MEKRTLVYVSIRDGDDRLVVNGPLDLLGQLVTSLQIPQPRGVSAPAQQADPERLPGGEGEQCKTD